MNKEELTQLLEELRTYHDLISMNGKSYNQFPIRDAVRLADKIYPLEDEFIEKHLPRHEWAKNDELEFNIKVPDYFYNIGCLIEEANFPPEFQSIAEALMWDYLSDDLRSFMECYAPDREYYVTGRSGGWLVVKHKFVAYRERQGKLWNDMWRKDKIKFLGNYGFTAKHFIEEIEELLFWYDFEEKLEKDKKSLCSKEWTKEFLEFLKDEYKDWVITEYGYYENLLKEVSV